VVFVLQAEAQLCFSLQNEHHLLCAGSAVDIRKGTGCFVQLAQWTLGRVLAAVVGCRRKCKTCSNETLTTTKQQQQQNPKAKQQQKCGAADGAPPSKHQAEEVRTYEQLYGSRPLYKS